MLTLVALFVLAGDPPSCNSPERTFRFDPVALASGRQVEGAPTRSVERLGYSYWFADDASRDAFLAAPEKYEIQYGGACGRMGPLGSPCGVERWATHDGRIFLFASDQCRETFIKAPETFVERADAPAVGDDAARARGAALVDRIVRGMGGAERVDAVRTYRAETRKDETHRGANGDVTWTNEHAWTIAFPASYREDQRWFSGASDSRYATVSTPAAAFATGASGARDLHPQQRAAFERDFWRTPLALVKARRNAGFAAIDAGTATVDGKTLDLVTISHGGATTTFGVEPGTDRVLLARSRTRGPRLTIGDLETRFVEFREVNGVNVAVRAEATFDGVRAAALDWTLSDVAIDGDVPAEVFARP